MISRDQKYLFFGIIFFEAWSFCGYFYPILNIFGFAIISLGVFLLAWKHFDYAVLAVFIELIIGSKGYLFSWPNEYFNLSLRMSLWLIVLSVWFGRSLVKCLNGENILNKEKRKPDYILYIFLFFIFFGIVNGFNHGHQWQNIFFDSNGWLFFLLIFPAREAFNRKEKILALLPLLLPPLAWVLIKSFALLFLFSHPFNIEFLQDVYRWVRSTGVGEITQIKGGFYRIFFQSHIYFLLVLFFIFDFLLKILSAEKLSRFIKNKKFQIFFFALSGIFSIIIISFSRSFWAGLILALPFFFGWQKIKKSATIRSIGLLVIICAMATVFSFSYIFITAKFPWPKPSGGFGLTELMNDRFNSLDEAAATSRWRLWPELMKKISEAPILGQGFGATVTYKTSDPRVLESNITGLYTTYAFEWGYLDIWLKLGIFGLINYIFLLGYLFYLGRISAKRNTNYQIGEGVETILIGLRFGLLALAFVSFFTPYLNHPLGLGFIILCYSVETGLNRSC
jgi:O-antigen ligase